MATTEYRADEDTLGRFIDECCVVGDDFEVSATTLYARYKTWADEGGFKPWTQTKFGTELVDKKYGKRKSCGRIYYSGIQLRET